MSKIIPRDRLADIQRWEMPNVDDEDLDQVLADPRPARPKRTEKADTEPRFPSLEEIETIQREAQEEGYNAGLEEGREEGRKQGLEAGRREGLEQGRREGLEAAQNEIEARVRELEGLLDFMAEPLKTLDERVEEELVRLTVAMARQLIRRELRSSPGEIIAVVRESLKLLPVASQNVILRLNPEDAKLVREVLGLGDDDGRAWKAIEDPALSRGGCKVESDLSRIDATVESRLNNVIATVLGDQRIGPEPERKGDGPPVEPPAAPRPRKARSRSTTTKKGGTDAQS